MNPEEKSLKKLSASVRISLLNMIYHSGSGHTGGSLSSVDILVSLYFRIMNIDPSSPDAPGRDRFYMSKGHSVEALYAVLSAKGFFDQNLLDTYGKKHSLLAGHPTRKVPGVELNSGALGHGLSVAAGTALAAKRTGESFRSFVLMGDGEQAEGSLMEAAAFAGHYKLDNLLAIIDRNRLQISGPTEMVMAVDDLVMKYQACGWAVKECPGNDPDELVDLMQKLPFEEDKPSLLIAHTTKGKGVSFMENQAGWHHRVPTHDEWLRAIKELETQL